MKAHGKGFLFIIVVISLIIGSPLLSNSSGSARAAEAISNYEVSGYLTPVSELSSVYFVGMYSRNSGDKGYFFQHLDTFPSGQTTPFSFTASYAGNAPSAYTILAIHDSLTYDGVTVGSNNIAESTSWDSLFAPQYTQANFNALLTGSYIGQYLEEFYANNTAYLGAPMGNNLSLINFSDASLGGSAYATSVPLPATLLLFVPGLVGLAAVRRRIKK